MKHKAVKKIDVREKLTAAYIMAMGSLFLIYPGTAGYGGITKEKWVTYLLFSAVYAVGMFVLGIKTVTKEKNGVASLAQRVKGLSAAEVLLMIFLGVTLLSALCSVHPQTALLGGKRLEGFVTIAAYVICCLLIARHGAAEKKLLWSFGVGASLCGLVAVIQFFGKNPLSLYPAGVNYYDGNKLYLGEYLGTIGNVDLLSAVLCVVIPVCWIGLLVLKSKEKWLLAIPLVISLGVLLKMFVAGGILGVFGGALLTLPVLAKEKKTRRVLAAAVALLMVLALGAVYAVGDSIGGFVAEASQILHGNVDDSFGSGRIYIWREVLKLVPERLLLGGGAETLGLRTNAAFERYDEDLQVFIRAAVDVAHNEYLNILVNQGLLALAAYLGALLLAAKGWIAHAAEDPAVAICGGAVLAYSIQACFGISSPISAPFFWIVFGLLLNALRKYSEKQ